MAEDPTATLQDASCDAFVKSLLPLYSGPMVTIRVAGREYKLSKHLICKQSRYFAKMFEEGKFKEGEEQSCDLEPIDDNDKVVTTQSFDILVQWMYLGKLVFSSMKPDEEITVALDLVRLADMVEVTGLETLIAEHIKNIILKNPSPLDHKWDNQRHGDNNMFHISSQHLRSAWKLPDGHPVRKILAAASVEGYFRCSRPKFYQETREIPGFMGDLLDEIKEVLTKIRMGTLFEEPISGDSFDINDR
ncbi:hypothetical protein LOCC1_G006240 [Lachnellula occidentalis]|uniref:BTB domain-containing protein n=1 Tax=Lachnellula occidentalis TaxID=215460 RepID=A0A8H8RLY4_9HELO|nr:hypothetical protein LOCC1_G006240 [Lachnellula occidentalis]